MPQAAFIFTERAGGCRRRVATGRCAVKMSSALRSCAGFLAVRTIENTASSICKRTVSLRAKAAGAVDRQITLYRSRKSTGPATYRAPGCRDRHGAGTVGVTHAFGLPPSGARTLNPRNLHHSEQAGLANRGRAESQGGISGGRARIATPRVAASSATTRLSSAFGDAYAAPRRHVMASRPDVVQIGLIAILQEPCRSVQPRMIQLPAWVISQVRN